MQAAEPPTTRKFEATPLRQLKAAKYFGAAACLNRLARAHPRIGASAHVRRAVTPPDAQTAPWERPKAKPEELRHAEFLCRLRHLQHFLRSGDTLPPAAFNSFIRFCRAQDLPSSAQILVHDELWQPLFSAAYWGVREMSWAVKGTIELTDQAWQLASCFGFSIRDLQTLTHVLLRKAVREAWHAGVKRDDHKFLLQTYVQLRDLCDGRDLDVDLLGPLLRYSHGSVNALSAPHALTYDNEALDATALASRVALALQALNQDFCESSRTAVCDAHSYAERIGAVLPSVLSAKIPVVAARALLDLQDLCLRRRGFAPKAVQVLGQCLVLVTVPDICPRFASALQRLAPRVLTMLVEEAKDELECGWANDSVTSLSRFSSLAAFYALDSASAKLHCAQLFQLQHFFSQRALRRLRGAEMFVDRNAPETWWERKSAEEKAARKFSRVPLRKRKADQKFTNVVNSVILFAEALGEPSQTCREHLWYTARPQGAAVNLALLILPDAAFTVPPRAKLLHALCAIYSSECIVELCYKPLLDCAGKDMREAELVDILHRVLVFVHPLMPNPALQDAMALIYVAAMRGDYTGTWKAQ